MSVCENIDGQCGASWCDCDYQRRKRARSFAAATGSEPEWRIIAIEALHALRLLNEHYDDLCKSNPGFMGKLSLQRYDLWNEALLVSERTLSKYCKVPNSEVSGGMDASAPAKGSGSH